MEILLAQFYQNDGMRDAVHAFLIENLKELTVDKAFSGEDTNGIMEAKLSIERAFTELTSRYGKNPKPKVDNQAR